MVGGKLEFRLFVLPRQKQYTFRNTVGVLFPTISYPGLQHVLLSKLLPASISLTRASPTLPSSDVYETKLMFLLQSMIVQSPGIVLYGDCLACLWILDVSLCGYIALVC